jgi:hypothetical protein
MAVFDPVGGGDDLGMEPARVECLAVRAVAADAPEELEAARAAACAGDSDWREWLDEHAAGQAMIVSLDVTVDYRDAEGRPGQVKCFNSAVWVESALHRPIVEEEVRQAVAKDFARIEDELHRRGVPVEARDLDRMFVHVELAPEVGSSSGGRPPASAGGVQAGLTTT